MLIGVAITIVRGVRVGIPVAVIVIAIVPIAIAGLVIVAIAGVLDISDIAGVSIDIVVHGLSATIRQINSIVALGPVAIPVLLGIEVDARIVVLYIVGILVVGLGVLILVIGRLPVTISVVVVVVMGIVVIVIVVGRSPVAVVRRSPVVIVIVVGRDPVVVVGRSPVVVVVVRWSPVIVIAMDHPVGMDCRATMGADTVDLFGYSSGNEDRNQEEGLQVRFKMEFIKWTMPEFELQQCF